MDSGRPHLAVLVYDFSASGVVRNALRIAAQAAAKGLETELWTMRAQGPLASEIPENVRVVEVALGAVGAHGLKRGLVNLFATPRLSRLIKDRRPHVILSGGNHFHFATGWAYRFAGRPRDVRFIGRASNAAPRLGRRRDLIGELANRVDALKYAGMHRVIAVSRELADSLTTRLGIPADRVTVIPNGVDVAHIAGMARQSLNHPWFAADQPPVVISAGRLTKQKNYPLLVEAFARARQQCHMRLVILGEGKISVKDSLLRQAASLGVAADVQLLGFVPNPMQFFARAKLFVLSSLWEGSSNVLLEALACGCPVVATDCPTGVREILNGGVGEIVPTGDAQSLSAAILRGIDANIDRGSLVDHARCFELRTTLARYVDLAASEASLANRQEFRAK
jgi:glycosyltransferase involved in cell wall biosynthesis